MAARNVARQLRGNGALNAKIICIIPTFEEEAFIATAVKSALEAGCDRVVIADGSFEGYSDHTESHDATVHNSSQAGAFVISTRKWKDGAQKLTFLFKACGATQYDHVLLLDADELVHGTLPPFDPELDYAYRRYNSGPNDIPKVRGNYPYGDYSQKPIPFGPRIFHWTRDLHCVSWGGIFARGDGQPIRTSHVAEGITVEHRPHLATQKRIQERLAYYPAEIARRRAIKANMGAA